MRFELHQRFRFDSEWTDEEYRRAEADYFSHLAAIDFRRQGALLRYFGNSFFHDADVRSLMWEPVRKAVTLELFSLNDLEDINGFRQRHALAPVGRAQFVADPIIYRCTFHAVSWLGVTGPQCASEGGTILDTELDLSTDCGDFVVRLSFAPDEEIEIRFRGRATVQVDPGKVSELLGGLRRSIPRCSVCRSRMLLPSNLARIAAGRHPGYGQGLPR